MTQQGLSSENWTDVLTVLAIAVLADHRLRDPELVEFCHEAKRLSNKYQPDVIMTRTHLRNWFFDNRLPLSSRLESDKAHEFMEAAIRKIDGAELQSDMLQSIFGIVVCDYHLDDEEAFMLKLAVEIWGMPVPRDFDDEMVA